MTNQTTKTTKLFFDTEFTGLHQNTTLISIGIIAESGETFYAEFTDYDKSQCDDWINENVIKNLKFTDREDFCDSFSQTGVPLTNTTIKGNTEYIQRHLYNWIIHLAYIGIAASEIEDGKRKSGIVEIWSDCLAYDWVLFCQLFGGAFGIPKEIYYIPFDLCTLFRGNGIDPDINREKFAEMEGGEKHNSLWDAKVIKMCYERAMGINP